MSVCATRAFAATCLALLLCAPTAPLHAQAPAPIRIAVETDMTGVYSKASGPRAVEAVKMAVDDFGGSVLGRKIEVVAIDHRNNPSEGAAKAREFWDDGGDLILDIPNSGVALAVMNVGNEKRKLTILTGAGSSDITGKDCSKYAYQYDYDSYSLAHGSGSQIAAAPDGKKWIVLYPNYAFGKAMLVDFSAAIAEQHGEVLHSDAVPLATADFSPYLLAARNAHPQVLAALSAGVDLDNEVKQAKQFGLDKESKIAVGILAASDVEALPDVFAGVRATISWFWN